MTRTNKKDVSGPKSNCPQPTKLTSRRGGGDTIKVEEAKNNIPRDVFHPSTLQPYRNKFENINNEGVKKNICKGRNFPASKIGLGPVMFNLKPQHYFNSKKTVDSSGLLDYYRKKYPDIAKRYNNDQKVNSKFDSDVTTVPDTPEPSLEKSLQQLTISEKEKTKDELKPKESKEEQSLMREAFKKLVEQKNAYEAGQSITTVIHEKKKTFKKSSSAIRKAGVRNWKSPETGEELHSGLLRNLFSWALSTSTRWKEVEDRVAKWVSMSKEGGENVNPVTVEEIAEQLKVTVKDVKSLQFHKDLKKVIEVMRHHVCHSTLPSLSTIAALSELQNGNKTGSTIYAAESQGTFLHSEIIDKHICYISRNEDPITAITGHRSSFSTKAELFRKQIQDTTSFITDLSNVNETSAFTKTISTFNSDWNIIQLTALIQSKNRFGLDLYSRRQIPQLLLSALATVPGEKERCSYTMFCSDPTVYEGSLMRLGLMEEFQKILDRNLVISDDSIVISRKNYWEERNKHNLAMQGVIQAMEEEWIGPWTFLLPGHTIHRDIQSKICSKVVNPAAKKYKLNSTQKLLLYKLTENYKYLHRSAASGLETIVSFILNISEMDISNSLCTKIREIGLEVPREDRHPTILIVDQDLEIYPWESMTCLSNTDVSRMPSLNLIRSNYNFVTSLRPSYPDIVNSDSCTFVLNPDGTLPNVQKRLEKYFVDHKTWLPVIGRAPATKEVQECLENQHVFLYNGHGAGSNFYPDYAVQKLICRAVPLLMGCASAQAHYAVPRVYGSSTIHSYFIAGCPSVVGYLWEVTDAECDRITVDLIERWLPTEGIRPPQILYFDQEAKREREKCLSTAMRLSRKAATQYLTQCAIVCYGLPINTQD